MIYAGLDLGGTKCAALLARVDGDHISFLCRKEVKTYGAWREVVNPLLDYIKTEAAAQNVTPLACGISCGGPLDSRKGVILSPPNLMSFKNAAITDYVSDSLGIPAKLQNDADACALAEWRFGAGRGTRNMIFLTFGTGLGAGLILDGHLYVGAKNLAGEVGHTRLERTGPIGYRKAGSFEGFCSGGGIAQLIQMRTGETYDAKELFQRAERGDAQAIDIWTEIGRQFGRGLAMLVDILNPEIIVAGSIFTRAYKYLYDPAMDSLEQEALPESLNGFRLLPAQLGDQIGDYAAIAIASSID
ncbi:MAG: ROK family protein [Oscillospiraceae bacterium]|jgi:glucokinase|nr:ROK family protein [Oscillospiraceae bacterium]